MATTLKMIDTFLRDGWLECCGHLSMFEIDGIKYDAYSDDMFVRNKSMNYKIRDVLEEKMVFRHEYDFGTTITLWLTVTTAGVPPLASTKGITALAVHDKVRFNCDVCGKSATKMRVYCVMYTDGSVLCDNCVRKHKCVSDDEEYLLDLVQSLRVSECGFDNEPLTLHD